MIEKTAEICTHILQVIVSPWRRVAIRIQGIILVGLPLLAVAISAPLALFGNHQRARIEADVHRHFQMASSMSDVLTLMVNAETGMRGYLLTQRDEFLHPYAIAAENLPTAMPRLRALAEAEQAYSSRAEKLTQLQRLIDMQMSDLAKQQQYISPPDKTNKIKIEIYSHLAYGKELMDKIRANLSELQAEEERLLDERIGEINAIRQRDYFAVFLVLFVAVATRLIAWYLFKTDILRRINQLVGNARALRFGESLPFVPTGKLDALGDLEQQIALASEQFLAIRRKQSGYYVIPTTGAQQSRIERIRKLG